jgi:hypothetical protein
MWMLAGCFVEPHPEAFDWTIDRTIVAGIAVWPTNGDASVPRRIDALVLSPHRVEEVRAEVCGLRTDEAVLLGFDSVACFAEPALRIVVPGELPTTWEPPEVSFECPELALTEGYIESEHTVVDTGGPIEPECSSTVPLRVYARSANDEASSMTLVGVYTEPWDPRETDPDPASATPRLEVMEGTVAAGGEVLLRLSVESLFDPDLFAWYADDGRFYGSGRTSVAGTDGDRQYGENWFEIPAGFHGALRVAAVANGDLWAVTTLEVP